MVPVTLGLGLINFNAIVDSLFASRLIDPEQAPTAIDKAFRIYMLPQGIFSVAVATILFPTLARLAARNDMRGVPHDLGERLASDRLPALPGQRCNGRPRDPARAAHLPARRVHARPDEGRGAVPRRVRARPDVQRHMLMLNRSFFSLQSPWVPTAVALLNLGLNAVLDAVFYRFGTWGIPLSTSVVNIAGTIALLWFLRRRIGRIELRETIRSTVRRAGRLGGAGGRLARGLGRSRLAARPVDRLAQIVSLARRARCRCGDLPRRRACSSACASSGRCSRSAAATGNVERTMEQSQIRNFSIIAHIDHGKSTLADRILELTDTVSGREMRDQLLDSMDLERERGITIKAQAVRVMWKGHELNLIDTPGHVDFTYEVSRSLAACEGALLVVDASQGIEAQTLANAYLAIENDLEIVPAVNKIDLPAGASPTTLRPRSPSSSASDPTRVLRISAKTGRRRGGGARRDRRAHPARRPATPTRPPRALIFDSSYDQYRGVVAFVRVVDGAFQRGEPVKAMAQGTRVRGRGARVPHADDDGRARRSRAGEVGYVITGLKDV